jgi:hypothetical protein
VWNIEGPQRKTTDAKKKKERTDMMVTANETQRDGFYKRRQDERDYELSEGKRLVQTDNENKDLE